MSDQSRKGPLGHAESQEEKLEMSRYINGDSYHLAEKTHPFYLEMIESIHDEISKATAASKKAKLLEIGSGTGLLTEELIAKHPKVEIHALEYDSQIYKILTKNIAGKMNGRATCICGDAVTFRTDFQYDVLVSSFAHDHISFGQAADFAKNIRRNLKQGGRYIMGGELIPFYRTEEERIDALYKYHLFIINKALREGNFDVSKLEIDALRSGVGKIGHFKRHEKLFEEEMSKDFKLVVKNKLGPSDISDVGGVFVYVFEAI